MTTLYKLTTQDNLTRKGYSNETEWGENVEHTAPGKGYLCTEGWLHAYTDPRLAVFMNPAHAALSDPKLWEAEGDVGKTDHGLKVGSTRLRTLREIPLPVLTTEQRIRAAIACARAVQRRPIPEWERWADGWLSGEDRTYAYAARAAYAAYAADAAAYAAFAARAARAAYAADDAAARAADAAAFAARAADAAAYAARAADDAARAADDAADIDMGAVILKALDE